MVTRKKNLLVFGSLGLIILGIVLASIIDRVTTSQSGSSDTRARAGAAKHLTANATVVSTDTQKRTLIVTDLYFTDESRTSEAKNLGSWIVTAPATFNLITVSPGTNLVIGLDAASFKVSNHTITAVSITPKK